MIYIYIKTYIYIYIIYLSVESCDILLREKYHSVYNRIYGCVCVCVCPSANNFGLCWVKVNFALERPMKYKRGSIGIVVLFL